MDNICRRISTKPLLQFVRGGGILPNSVFETETILSLGTRNFDEPQVPFKSRNGNKITTAVFRLLYGKLIRDTQTGLRGISNSFLPACLTLPGERFEYEINMLIEAVRRRLTVTEVPIQTVYFDSNRETHFRPFADSAKIYRVMLASFFRFSFSGILSVLVDQGLFAFLSGCVFSSLSVLYAIPLATALSRIVSSLVNYFLNSRFVFNGTPQRGSICRYYILCVCQLAASAALVTLLHLVTHANASLLKLLVDSVLFFVSYRIQQKWVFRKEAA